MRMLLWCLSLKELCVSLLGKWKTLLVVGMIVKKTLREIGGVVLLVKLSVNS